MAFLPSVFFVAHAVSPDAHGDHGRVRGRGCGSRFACLRGRCALHRQRHLPHDDLSVGALLVRALLATVKLFLVT